MSNQPLKKAKLDSNPFTPTPASVPVAGSNNTMLVLGVNGDKHHNLTESAQRLLQDRDTLALHSLPTRRTPKLMFTASLPDHKRMKILITGGAGFVGSHLTDALMMQGHEVTVLDNFFTGSKKNIEHWLQHPNFTLVVHDVTEPIRLVRSALLVASHSFGNWVIRAT